MIEIGVLPPLVTERMVQQVNSLLFQLSGKTTNVDAKSLQSYVLVHDALFAFAEENNIVGMATLITYNKLTRITGLIEDVVVDEQYRSQGVARRLLEQLIKVARNLGLQEVNLTSNPRRVAAHALYRSLGFVVPGTTYFRKQL